jgi:hypothetical protein
MPSGTVLMPLVDILASGARLAAELLLTKVFAQSTCATTDRGISLDSASNLSARLNLVDRTAIVLCPKRFGVDPGSEAVTENGCRKGRPAKPPSGQCPILHRQCVLSAACIGSGCPWSNKLAYRTDPAMRLAGPQDHIQRGHFLQHHAAFAHRWRAICVSDWTKKIPTPHRNDVIGHIAG